MEMRTSVHCPVCRAKAARRALFCRRCGTSLRSDGRRAARWFFGLSAVCLLVGSAAASAMLPLELIRLSLACLGLGFLGSGTVLLWASLVLLRVPRGTEARRLLALHALEAARVEPLPIPSRGEFIDRFLARKKSGAATADLRCG